MSGAAIVASRNGEAVAASLMVLGADHVPHLVKRRIHAIPSTSRL
jgi:hypothetical protein